jgi:hypothetical protein
MRQTPHHILIDLPERRCRRRYGETAVRVMHANTLRLSIGVPIRTSNMDMHALCLVSGFTLAVDDCDLAILVYAACCDWLVSSIDVPELGVGVGMECPDSNTSVLAEDLVVLVLIYSGGRRNINLHRCRIPDRQSKP